MILYVYIVYTYTYIRVCCWAKGCCGGGMMMGVYSCERGFSVVLRISSCLCLPEKYQQWIVGEFQCTGILHGFEYSSFKFAHARYPMLCIVSTLVLSRNIFPLKRIPVVFRLWSLQLWAARQYSSGSWAIGKSPVNSEPQGLEIMCWCAQEFVSSWFTSFGKRHIYIYRLLYYTFLLL